MGYDKRPGKAGGLCNSPWACSCRHLANALAAVVQLDGPTIVHSTKAMCNSTSSLGSGIRPNARATRGGWCRGRIHPIWEMARNAAMATLAARRHAFLCHHLQSQSQPPKLTGA